MSERHKQEEEITRREPEKGRDIDTSKPMALKMSGRLRAQGQRRGLKLEN